MARLEKYAGEPGYCGVWRDLRIEGRDVAMLHHWVGLLLAAVLAVSGPGYAQPGGQPGDQSGYPSGNGPSTLHSARFDDQEDLIPKFWYEVQFGDTLSGIAQRFGSRVPWILRMNPQIRSAHLIRQGQVLMVPIDFPLPGGVAPKGIKILPARFLGSYEVNVPFAEIQDFMLWYAATLEEYGFEVSVNATNPVDGITLRDRGVVLGRISFSAGDADGLSQMDIGLLFIDDGEGGGEAGDAVAADLRQSLRLGNGPLPLIPALD